MKAITVRQPWAWAIIHGGKDVENRTRNIAGAYRGPLAIHAAKGIDLDAYRQHEHLFRPLWDAWWEQQTAATLPDLAPWRTVGHVIGVVDLVDVHRGPDRGPEPVRGCWRPADVLGWVPLVENDEYARCSAWGQADHHHLVLANPRPLARPTPWRGRLGLWNLPDDVVREVPA